MAVDFSRYYEMAIKGVKVKRNKMTHTERCRGELIKQHIRSNGPTSCQQMSFILERDYTVVYRTMNKLRMRNELKMTGTGSKCRWEIV